jgi:hypothetical protein
MVRTWRTLLPSLLALMLSASRFHPIHAARVELDVAADGTVNALVHVYRDDFPAIATLPEIATYLDKVLLLTDARAARILLRPTGMEPEGDRLRISLVGTAAAGLSHGHIALTLLQERFPDEVNVVDARLPGHRAQLVFLRGDGPQALP